MKNVSKLLASMIVYFEWSGGSLGRALIMVNKGRGHDLGG